MNNVQRIEKLELTTNFQIGPVNSYLVFGDKLTLIDVGLKYEKAWQELNEGLKAFNLKLTDIQQIVLTHHHHDHVGLLEWILEKHPSVSVFAHKNTEMLLQDTNYLAWSYEFFEKIYFDFGLPTEMVRKFTYRKQIRPRIKGLKIDLVLQEGDTVPGLPGWKVIETAGHSQDHISLYCPKEEQLICGDFLIKGMHVGIFLDAPMPGKDRAKPLLQYLNNLEKCRKLFVKKAYSGHGPDIDQFIEAIDAQKKNIENRLKRTIVAMKKINRPCTGFEIIQEMYPSRYKKQVITFLLEIISVLDLLQVRNQVVVEKRNGVDLYRLVDK